MDHGKGEKMSGWDEEVGERRKSVKRGNCEMK